MNDKSNNWLKLKIDFFQSLPLKKIRKIAGGDTYIIIYQKLMLLTVNSEGHYRLQGVESTIEEELSLILDEDVDNIKVCLQLMGSFKLLEFVNDNVIYFPQVSMLVGKSDDSAVRVAAYRERKKLQCNALQTLQVTESNYPREREREREDKEKIKKENSSASKLAFDFTNFSDEQISNIKEWFEYRKEIKKPYKSQRTLDALRKELLVNKNLIRDIQWSISKGYQAIYAPNANKQANYHVMGDFTGQQSGEVEF